MRLPSHQRRRVCRALVAARRARRRARRRSRWCRPPMRRPAIAATSSSPRASAARSSSGGGGVGLRHALLGRLARRRRLLGRARHEGRVPRHAHENADGTRTYVPAGGTQTHGLPHLRQRLPRTCHGLGHVQRVGRLRAPAAARQGHVTVNGRKSRWNGPAIKLGKAAEGRQAALSSWRSPARRRPAPPAPPAAATTPPVTTTTTTPAESLARARAPGA